MTTSSYRIEPEIETGRTAAPVFDRSHTRSFELRTGLFFVSRYDAGFFPLDETELLVGGHLGLSWTTSSRDDRKSEDSFPITTFSVGPALGGEYSFNEALSIGIEVRFLSVNPLGASPGAQFRTDGVASLRYHF